MTSIENIKIEEIEKILKMLGYFEIEFKYYSEESNTVWYDGYLDTDYRIQIKIIDQNTIEIWDCDYYIDNFVREGIAKKNEQNIWEVF